MDNARRRVKGWGWCGMAAVLSAILLLVGIRPALGNEWIKGQNLTYGSGSYESAHPRFLLAASDGFVYGGWGSRYHPLGNDRSHFQVGKVDLSGEPVWANAYGDPASEEFVLAMASMPGDRTMIAMKAADSGNQGAITPGGRFLAVLSPTGSVESVKTYQDAYGINAIAGAAGGGFFLAYSDRVSPYLKKLDANLSSAWDWEFSGINFELSEVVPADDGGCFALFNPQIPAGSNPAVLRLDADGRPLWAKYFAGASFRALARAPGGVVAVGLQESPRFSVVMKLDDAGSIVWQKKFDYSVVQLSTVTLLANGDLALGGGYPNGSLGMAYSWLARMDAAGTILWQKFYGQERQRMPAERVVESAAGNLTALTSRANDVLFTSVDATGELLGCQWSRGDAAAAMVDAGLVALDVTGQITVSAPVAPLALSDAGTELFAASSMAASTWQVCFADSFESPRAIPEGWLTRSLGPADGTVSGIASVGTRSFQIAGSRADKRLIKVSRASGKAGDRIRISGQSMAQGASAWGGSYALEAKVHYRNGTTETHALAFPKRSHGWVRLNKSVTARRDFKRVDLSLRYARQRGKTWFDGIVLNVQ